MNARTRQVCIMNEFRNKDSVIVFKIHGFLSPQTQNVFKVHCFNFLASVTVDYIELSICKKQGVFSSPPPFQSFSGGSNPPLWKGGGFWLCHPPQLPPTPIAQFNYDSCKKMYIGFKIIRKITAWDYAQIKLHDSQYSFFRCYFEPLCIDTHLHIPHCLCGAKAVSITIIE